MQYPYADFAYYKDTYHGVMPETDFTRLSLRACAELDTLTLDRISAVTDERTAQKARAACCAVADALLLNEQGGGIASESNDGVTVNYLAGVKNAQTEQTEGSRVYEAALRYLGVTGLLYRGFRYAAM